MFTFTSFCPLAPNPSLKRRNDWGPENDRGQV
jgi:hypothetical protein